MVKVDISSNLILNVSFFTDAPSIEEPKTQASSMENFNFRTSNFCIDSIDTSLNEPSDNDSFIQDEDDENFDFDDEKTIDKEFEEYLNDENENFVDNEEKRLKLKKLESLKLNFDNYDEIRKLAIEKYGFVNKKIRQKAWPILILHKNRSMSSPNAIIDSSLKTYDQMSWFNNILVLFN